MEKTKCILKDNSIFKPNYKNKTDGLLLMSDIYDESIPIAFFDPQYRGVLDKLHYGNEGCGRGRSRTELRQMDKTIINKFITEISRILYPCGYLFLWVDKYHLCQGISSWMNDTKLQTVDLITWDKGRMGMGYRSRRQCEYLLILQKKPIKAKATWRIHNIPDVWREKILHKNHPHSKPINLQTQLIMATTYENEYVLDPASGGYSVMEACNKINRNFIGGDIEHGENCT